MGITRSVSTGFNNQDGTKTLLAPKGLQNSECLTPVAILSPVVRGNKLAERKGNVAIYQGPYPGAFEVIVIRVAEASVLGRKVVPRREVYRSKSYARRLHRL
jgi:hypothetical protein